MNQSELKYFGMFVQTQRFLDDSNDKWATIPAIVRIKNSLDEGVQQIREKDLLQSGETKGTTISKNELKDQVALKVAIICGAMYVYANEMGNAELEQQSNYSPTALARLSDNEFAQKVTILMQLANTHITNLSDQGISPELITEVTTSLDDFREMIGMSRTISIKRSSASSEVADLIKDTNTLLRDQLDRLMMRFRLLDETYYDGYHKARVLLD